MGNYPFAKMTLIPETQNLLGPNQGLPLFTGDHFEQIYDDWIRQVRARRRAWSRFSKIFRYR